MNIFSLFLSLSFSRSPNPHSLSLLFTMMYEISALDMSALPREAETTRAGDESSSEEAERRRLDDWPNVVVEAADRCCLGRADEAEMAIAARGAQERAGALARGQEAREAMVIFRVEEAETKRRRERERRK